MDVTSIMSGVTQRKGLPERPTKDGMEALKNMLQQTAVDLQPTALEITGATSEDAQKVAVVGFLEKASDVYADLYILISYLGNTPVGATQSYIQSLSKKEE